MKPGALLVAVACLAWGVLAHAQTGNVAVSMDSHRDIVLAVANPIDPPATHAGSSLLGYAPSGNYGAGQRAASILAALQRNYRWRQLVGWPIKSLDLYCIVLEPPAGTRRDMLLAALARDKRVQLVEPLRDFSVYSSRRQDAHRYNDPYVDLQRGFRETDAGLAQAITQGAGVDIAIVDTGADVTHPDLRGQIRDVHNMVDDDASTFDRDHHGTEVAGIIAAIADNHRGIVGMAPKAGLSVYKACWYPPDSEAGARCNSFTLAKAIAAVTGTNARIVNLSLGGPSDPLLSRLLQRVVEHHVVVAALPPDGKLDGFPADVPGVIVVNASGSPVDPPGVLNAPGNDILTTQPNGGYDFTSGSSMAAAQVSGIAALLVSLDPGLDGRAIHDLLARTSKTVDGVSQVNAAAAVAALHAEPPRHD
ncbi:MAG TPA: S8 family serine peptidase [Rhodanobacteraceae bacterium]|nr:S8 family serine peptidase [Rhodanobacteraceae bacterium]